MKRSAAVSIIPTQIWKDPSGREWFVVGFQNGQVYLSLLDLDVDEEMLVDKQTMWDSWVMTVDENRQFVTGAGGNTYSTNLPDTFPGMSESGDNVVFDETRSAAAPPDVPANVYTDPEAAAGWDAWIPAAGGAEEPFQTRDGRTLLYVFNPATGQHAYLDTATDTVLSDGEAEVIMADRKSRTADGMKWTTVDGPYGPTLVPDQGPGVSWNKGQPWPNDNPPDWFEDPAAGGPEMTGGGYQNEISPMARRVTARNVSVGDRVTVAPESGGGTYSGTVTGILLHETEDDAASQVAGTPEQEMSPGAERRTIVMVQTKSGVRWAYGDTVSLSVEASRRTAGVSGPASVMVWSPFNESTGEFGSSCEFHLGEDGLLSIVSDPDGIAGGLVTAVSSALAGGNTYGPIRGTRYRYEVAFEGQTHGARTASRRRTAVAVDVWDLLPGGAKSMNARLYLDESTGEWTDRSGGPVWLDRADLDAAAEELYLNDFQGAAQVRDHLFKVSARLPVGTVRNPDYDFDVFSAWALRDGALEVVGGGHLARLVARG